MNAAEEISAAFCFLFGWGRGGTTQPTLELHIEIVNMRAIAPVMNALYTGIKDNALHLFTERRGCMNLNRLVKQLTKRKNREGTEIIPSLLHCCYRFSSAWEV